ncbi:MAG TPA: hypothetical protein VHT30_02065 [Acidimicrobiales bacterium]|nr:hypothetical protein [Acidimicrobiales bacterium]
MIVVDEYLAVDVLRGQWPDALPDDDLLGLPATHHYRLLQRIHQPGTGRLSEILAGLSNSGRESIRRPHPDIVQVLDPRPLLDQAASIGARYRTGGLLITETPRCGPDPSAGPLFRHRRQRRPPSRRDRCRPRYRHHRPRQLISAPSTGPAAPTEQPVGCYWKTVRAWATPPPAGLPRRSD